MPFRATVSLVAVVAFAAGGASASSPLAPVPPSYASPSWSPNGEKLVFLSAQGPRGWLVSVGADGTNLRRLVRADVPFQVAWSPRGDRIAYAAQAGLFVIGSGGTGKRRVGSGTGFAWSADGARIAFEGSRSFGIHVVAASGRGARRLTNGRYDHAPAWAPDGSRIVFSRARRADVLEMLFVVRSDGTGLHALGVQGTAPAWSPDGARIAYWRKTNEGVALAVANADGTTQVTLTRSLPAFSRAPAWSPDGKRLLITICTAGPCRIDVADPDAGSVERIASGVDPVWAPDSERIAFSTRRYCRSSSIFLMNRDGSGLSRLTPCP